MRFKDYFFPFGHRSGPVEPIVAPEDRADVVAVWDMATMNGGDVANIVPGATEYDLALSSTRFGGSDPSDDPAISSTGLVFKAYGANQNEGLAAGGGTASIPTALTFYAAFRRIGTTVGGSFGTTTLVNSTLAVIRTLDPEESPRIHTPNVDSPYTVGRWNDGLPHMLCAIVEATRTRMFLDGSQIMDVAQNTSLPVTLSALKFSELTKSFAGTIYWAGAFNTAHNAATQADIFSQVASTLADRNVTIAPSKGYVVFEGDSITETSYVVGGLSQYPYLALTTMAPIAPAINRAVHSQVISDFVARGAQIDAYFAASQSTIKVLSILATNDIQAGSAATAYANLKSYCAARKAATPGLIIIVGTAVVRDVAGYEAKRLSYKALINGGDASYDAVADYGSDVFLGDVSQAVLDVATDYFVDGIHPNAAGHARMAAIFKPIIHDILGIQPTPTIPHVEANLGINGGTTAAINSTGTNLIVVNVASYAPGGAITVTDSKGNTYAPLTARGGAVIRNQLFYCYAPAVGAGHTFTIVGTGVYCSAQVAAFIGLASLPFDQQNGANYAAWVWADTGTITPSQGNTLVIAGLAFETPNSEITIENGFTIIGTSPYIGGSEGGSIAYKIVAGTIATRAEWNNASGASVAAGVSIANFKY